MANDEFVDLDDIIPGTGFRKRQDDAPVKKETPKTDEAGSAGQPKAAEPKVEPKAKPEVPKIDAQKIVDTSEEIEEETISFKQADSAKLKEKTQKAPEKKPTIIPEKRAPVKTVKPEIKQEKKIEVVKAETKAPEKKQEKPQEKIQEKPARKPLILKKKSKDMKITKENKYDFKKENKTTRKQKSLSKTEGKQTNWILIALLILGVVIIAVVAYMILKFDFPGSEQDSVVAVVNGEPIYKSELQSRLNLLRTTLNPSVTEEQVLNLTITDRLLLQEAQKRGIRVSDEEVDVRLEETMLNNYINETMLRGDLESRNVSYAFFKDVYKDTLTIDKLRTTAFGNLNVTDEELEEFYKENEQSLKVPDMVTVRHILFKYGQKTETETYEQANDVFEQIKEDRSNFCSLAAIYTEDDGSKNICGEYNFSKEYPYVPEFIEAGFNMLPGDVKIIKTQLGYHIMYKVENIPEHVPELESIEASLMPVLKEAKSWEELQALIAALQSKAIIEIYNENITAKRFSEITADDNPKLTETEAAPPETIPAIETQGEEVIDAPTEVVVTKEIVNTPSSQKYILAKCLSDGGNRMFTASWSPDSKAQLSLFEEYAQDLIVIECDPESKNANLAECTNVLKKQYPTWPTWQIDGTLYEGIQSLSALAKYSNCTY